MRVVMQRVTQASVTVGQDRVGEIGHGLVLLVGIGPEDTAAICAKMAHKIAHLRVFADEAGRTNLSLLETCGAVLLVSQFTLLADCNRGRRPYFGDAAKPDMAEPLVEKLASCLQEAGIAQVACGQFGAEMDVALCNRGPMTVVLDM